MERVDPDASGDTLPPGGATPETGLDGLLAEVALGDMAAFEELYRRLCGPVYGLARRVLRDREQAEEVLQEVFTEVWQHAPRFDPRLGSARGWTLTLAHRRAVDRVRSEQAAADRMADSRTTIPETTGADDVSDRVAHRMERERVRRCLRRLTEIQRETVRLTYYTGYTQREAATLLGVPLTTVKGRLRDGLIRLRDCLGVIR